MKNPDERLVTVNTIKVQEMDPCNLSSDSLFKCSKIYSGSLTGAHCTT